MLLLGVDRSNDVAVVRFYVSLRSLVIKVS